MKTATIKLKGTTPVTLNDEQTDALMNGRLFIDNGEDAGVILRKCRIFDTGPHDMREDES